MKSYYSWLNTVINGELYTWDETLAWPKCDWQAAVTTVNLVQQQGQLLQR